jgi:methyl-accepting chemotaxis protein
MYTDDVVTLATNMVDTVQQAAASTRAAGEAQEKSTEAILALDRAAKELTLINQRLAEKLDALRRSLEGVNQNVQAITRNAQGVAAQLSGLEPATPSLTDDAVVFTPEHNERIKRAVLAIAPDRLELN